MNAYAARTPRSRFSATVRKRAESWPDCSNTIGAVVLGLARGGVPVAWEVAAALGAPLDALVVRKLGAPGNPEFAIGALAPDGRIVVNDDMIRGPGACQQVVGAFEVQSAGNRPVFKSVVCPRFRPETGYPANEPTGQRSTTPAVCPRTTKLGSYGR